MSALLNPLRDSLLAKLRERTDLDPFKDLVTGTNENPEDILGFEAQLHSTQLAQLRAICDKYRKTPSQVANEGRLKSGIAVILGIRGAGKTTLFHRLRNAQPTDFVLRPRDYRPDRPFPQYLLQEIVSELDQSSQKLGNTLLDSLASQLAAEITFRKIKGMTETEWLREYSRWKTPPTWIANYLRDWMLHWGLPWVQNDISAQKEILQTLEVVDKTWVIAPLLAQYIGNLEQLQRLAEVHIRESESAVDLQGVIRAALYRRLVRLGYAVTEERKKEARNKLMSFLFDGYLKEYRGDSSPNLVVETLLRTLIGLLHYYGISLIVSFDALDTNRMLGDPPDKERTHHFYSGLADFRDNYDASSAVGFLLFSEEGYWNATSGLRSSYAQDRISEGIGDVSGFGTIATIALEPVGLEIGKRILRKRLAPCHEMLKSCFPNQIDALDDFFPFTAEDVESSFSLKLNSLRMGLLSLKVAYQKALKGEMIFATEILQVETVTEATIPDPPPFEEMWVRIRSQIVENMESNISGLADRLHSTLNDWLSVGDFSAEGWSLIEIELKSFGATAYEQFVLCRWRNGNQSLTCAVGILVGFKQGLSNDLRKKLAILAQQKKSIKYAILLYPTSGCATMQPPYHAHLPSGTKKTWEQASPSKFVQLRPISFDPVIDWLSVGALIEQVGTASYANATKELDEFIRQKTQHLKTHLIPSFGDI